MEFEGFRAAINRSVAFSRAGQHQEALHVVDEAIAEAIEAGNSAWVLTLSHHAAVLSRELSDLALTKRYYETSLKYNPENPRALYGLAKIAREEGWAEVAKDYAVRSYRAILQSEDSAIKQSLLDSLVEQWPDVDG